MTIHADFVELLTAEERTALAAYLQYTDRGHADHGSMRALCPKLAGVSFAVREQVYPYVLAASATDRAELAAQLEILNRTEQ
jgi:hypothetical protein